MFLFVSSSTLAAASVASLLIGLSVVFLFGICSKKKKPILEPSVDMRNMGAGPAGMNGPPSNAIDSMKNFQPTPDGKVNDREAPETMVNKDKFQTESANFGNISDFRGPNVHQSEKIQADRANMSAKYTPVTVPQPAKAKDTDSEYDSQYETESEDEGASKAPKAPERVTVQGRQPVPSSIDPKSGVPTSSKKPDTNSRVIFAPPRAGVDSMGSVKSELEEDLEAAIKQPPNYNILTPSVNRGQVNMESFAFTKSPVQTGHVSTESKKVKKKVKKKKRVKKVDAHGKSVRVRTVKIDPLNPTQSVVRKKKKKKKSENSMAI